MLFDEHVSPRVARALRELGLRVAHVGGPEQPGKGSEDGDVLAHAQRTNQTIVTTNHDMIVLCAESNEPVIWLSPRDKDISLLGLTHICFTQVYDWERELENANEPVCVIAYKTKCEATTLDRATRLALERGKRRRRAQARKKKASPPGGLLPPDAS